jgi:flagellar biosynthesis protein FlhF
MVLHTRVLERASGKIVEVVAAPANAVEALQRRLDGARAAAERAKSRARVGPYVVALVGPPGAGKTTTAVKLALHPRGLASRRVGLVTLDTHRVGAVEELQTYAEIADLPMEVVYHKREVRGVVERLRDRDVIVVDTPGRHPQDGDGSDWRAALEAFDPDEVHIVLPAGVRLEVAEEYVSRFRETGVTHALYSKLDELSEDRGLAQIAQALDLPARWVADGYEIPASLAPAGPRILGSLGLKSAEIRPNLKVV